MPRIPSVEAVAGIVIQILRTREELCEDAMLRLLSGTNLLHELGKLIHRFGIARVSFDDKGI